jgi:hypothetical protein
MGKNTSNHLKNEEKKNKSPPADGGFPQPLDRSLLQKGHRKLLFLIPLLRGDHSGLQPLEDLLSEDIEHVQREHQPSAVRDDP